MGHSMGHYHEHVLYVYIANTALYPPGERVQ
jgi:hypothetical protein